MKLKNKVILFSTVILMSLPLVTLSCKKITNNDFEELKKNNPNFNFIKEGIDYILKSVDSSLKEKEEINLPNFITKISDKVFKDFRKLRKINLENIKEIGKEAFSNTNLEELKLDSLNKLDPSTFLGCKSITKINTPKLETIESKTFQNYENLKEISLENVKEIKDYAFYACKLLKK